MGSHAPRDGRCLAYALAVIWLGAAVAWELACPLAATEGVVPRIATCIGFLTGVVHLITGVRLGPVRDLRRVREVARATQQVLLRPLPARLDGLSVVAGQLSANRAASVGGDLYEAVVTPHGVRIVMGDVRGHGLTALGAVAAVLGCFREAAHDEPELTGVLSRMDRTLQRYLLERSGGSSETGEDAEEFVTVLLLEVRDDDEVWALNCGHPWPRLIDRGAEPLAAGDPLPPLGPFPLPAELTARRCTRLLPGEALCLYTDGAEDNRDAAGLFFRLDEVLVEAACGRPVPPAEVIRRAHAALLRHTGGRLTDDVALLVLRNDRHRTPAARTGAPTPARVHR
ncbi:PP2C family protein-serine/threonine phosphatase [Streptomyces sannanensis]|uniref:PP2C family protein-serine/threonine phosphatase n=2 Tax=Streptomyces sannanensis TaxID=285536 RepID=A0ABP6S6U1_9ACTN